MLKDFLIVGAGSFVGGGLRMLVSRYVDSHVAAAVARASVPAAMGLPLGTLAVNSLGCFAIGFVAGLPAAGGMLPPQARAFLTTGFCGGFTTFSTFISENTSIMRADNLTGMAAYIATSLMLGFMAFAAGQWAARMA